MNGIHEVVGSIPIGSTILLHLHEIVSANRPGLLHIEGERRMVAQVGGGIGRVSLADSGLDTLSLPCFATAKRPLPDLRGGRAATNLALSTRPFWKPQVM